MHLTPYSKPTYSVHIISLELYLELVVAFTSNMTVDINHVCRAHGYYSSSVDTLCKCSWVGFLIVVH